MYTESTAAIEDLTRRAETATTVLTSAASTPLPQTARIHPSVVRPPALAVPVTWYSKCKRGLDVIGALLVGFVVLPIIALLAVLIKLTSRGPVFYSQTRVGRAGPPFTIWKIRSMYNNCEQYSGARWSQAGDPRVMPLGRILRRTHLDELPQLWNVLRGDMSLIGPRPERPEFVPQLEQGIPCFRERLLVLPGVTGLAQIHLGPDTDLESVERTLMFDLYYIKHLSFLNDLRILLATTIHVIKPFIADRWFFRLSAEWCAADVLGHQTSEVRSQKSEVDGTDR
jgi:lipopolysaccharide/colanic/teichoic acid biosynthesis glycosyltransferase